MILLEKDFSFVRDAFVIPAESLGGRFLPDMRMLEKNWSINEKPEKKFVIIPDCCFGFYCCGRARKCWRSREERCVGADRGAGGPWGLDFPFFFFFFFFLPRVEIFPMKVFLPQSPRAPIAAAGSFRRRGARRWWKTSAQLFHQLAFSLLSANANTVPCRAVPCPTREKKDFFPLFVIVAKQTIELSTKRFEKLAKMFCAPWDWTYVRLFHVRGVVDSRNSGLTLANVPIVPDPVAQQG